MAKTPAPPVGALFTVNAVAELMDGEHLVARYLPDMGSYRVTLTNADFVAALIDQGKAVVVGVSKSRRAAGVVTVGQVAKKGE